MEPTPRGGPTPRMEPPKVVKEEKHESSGLSTPVVNVKATNPNRRKKGERSNPRGVTRTVWSPQSNNRAVYSPQTDTQNDV